jgi:hypothetical protein
MFYCPSPYFVSFVVVKQSRVRSILVLVQHLSQAIHAMALVLVIITHCCSSSQENRNKSVIGVFLLAISKLASRYRIE